jgi:hypothetical protein
VRAVDVHDLGSIDCSTAVIKSDPDGLDIKMLTGIWDRKVVWIEYTYGKGKGKW